MELRADSRERREKETKKRGRSWLWSILIVLGVIILLGGGFLFIYNLGWPQNKQAEGVPLLAPDGPAKVPPEHPGGMDIPHQDKLVYNRIGQNAENARVERLLPPPDPPKPLTPPPEESEKTVVPKSTPAATDRKSDLPEKQVGPLATKPVPIVPPKPKTPPRSTAESRSALTKTWRIQIAAVRSEKAARAEWAKQRKKYPSLLGSLTLEVQKVEVKSKGTFYRVRGGPLTDRAAADRLCAALKQQGGACLPVKPGG